MEEALQLKIKHFQIGFLKKKFNSVKRDLFWDFPGGPVVKNPSTSVENMGLIPGLGRSHVLRSS